MISAVRGFVDLNGVEFAVDARSLSDACMGITEALSEGLQ